MSAARQDPDRSAARPVALALLTIWAVLTVLGAIELWTAPQLFSGQTDGLTPVEHREARGRPLVLLRADLDAMAQLDPHDELTAAKTDPLTVLAEAGFAIEEALGDERVPLAPPRTEITRWLDAHSLYLLPLDAHDELAERLSDERMQAQVRGIEARLSSPLFSVAGTQPRRDPLAIHELGASEAGRLGHVAEAPGARGPQVSASGDLISASGDRALVQLISDRPPGELREQVQAAVEELPVKVQLVDPQVREHELVAALVEDGPRVAVAALAGLILVLSVVTRRLIPVLALALGLASSLVLGAWVMLALGPTRHPGGLDLGAVALLVALLGVACDLGLRQGPIGARGWISASIFAGALAPLWLLPYPEWHRMAVVWGAAVAVTAVVLRLVPPALLGLLGPRFSGARAGLGSSGPGKGAAVVAMPVVAVLVCAAVAMAGGWAVTKLPYRSGVQLPVASSPPRARELAEHFFDPAMIVEARTPAPAEPDPSVQTSEAAALDAASAEVEALSALVPRYAQRVDSPASFVLPQAELDARKEALAKLHLDARMEALKVMLDDQGLRAEAFAEFVDGAADIEDMPSAQAALDGPLGPWIRGYLIRDPAGSGEDTVALRTRVELHASASHDSLPATPPPAELLDKLPTLRGPAIAAIEDQRNFDDRLAVAVLAGLWLTSFLVWLGTGSLAIAVAVALCAVSAQSGALLGLSLLDQALGPHLLPVLLLVGAAAGVAGGRACRALSLARAGAARGLLLAGVCQVVSGAVLLVSAQPLWRELGLALAIGSLLATGLGLFAAPGLAGMLEKLRSRRGRAEQERSEEGSKKEGGRGQGDEGGEDS